MVGRLLAKEQVGVRFSLTAQKAKYRKIRVLRDIVWISLWKGA